jgi:hypothetical protein
LDIYNYYKKQKRFMFHAVTPCLCQYYHWMCSNYLLKSLSSLSDFYSIQVCQVVSWIFDKQKTGFVVLIFMQRWYIHKRQKVYFSSEKMMINSRWGTKLRNKKLFLCFCWSWKDRKFESSKVRKIERSKDRKFESSIDVKIDETYRNISCN